MCEEINEFDICPYTDAEAVEALGKLADHPAVLEVSKALFPDKEPEFLRTVLKSVRSIDEFQILVMNKAVEWVLSTTAHNFSYDGIANIKGINGKFLAMSNHRDIILDPAITQVVLYRNAIPLTEIAVGSNLLSRCFRSTSATRLLPERAPSGSHSVKAVPRTASTLPSRDC